MQHDVSKRVLLVDDDEDTMTIFKIALSSVDPGALFLYARDGTDGLVMLQKMVALPSVIFLDLAMPIADGREFLRNATHCPRISTVPILVCSTTQDRHKIEEVRLLGASGFIAKPDTFSGFQDMIRTVLCEAIPRGSHPGGLLAFEDISLL